jgi:hypothetical protein
MADSEVNIKITAQDKASPTIKAVGKELSNFGKGVGTVQQALNTFAVGTLPGATAAMGNFSSGVAQLTGKLGVLIGTGGMAGLAAAALTLGAHLEDLKNDFADWVTGMGDAGEGLDKLDSKTEAYIKTLKGLQNQLELVNLAGVARTAAEFGQRQREVSHLERQVEDRRAAIARLELLRKEQAKGFGIPGVGYITPGLKATEESLKRANEELADLSRQLGIARTQGALAAATLNKELVEEGKKGFEELTRAADKFAQKLEEIDREGRRREAMAKIPAMRESEFLIEKQPLPSILSPEQIQKMQEGMSEGLQELNREALEKSQKRTDEELDYYFDEGLKVQHKLDDMREDAWREQQRQYERMIDGIRDGAGRVFDAMLTKGESVFSSLAKFAEGVMQTMLRNIFQDAVTTLAASSGMLQRLLGGGRGAGGAGGGGVAGGVIAGLGPTMFTKLGFGGGGGGAHLQDIAAGKVSGAASSAGGASAGLFGLTGVVGGLATFGIGLGAAFGASFLSGLFNRGEKRRAEEAARRAGIIEAQQFAAPETITRYGTWGGPGEFAVEPDLTGQIRGIGRVPTVVVNVENNMIDARHAREAGEVIGQAVSQQLLAGGSLLADNVAWAAGAP